MKRDHIFLTPLILFIFLPAVCLSEITENYNNATGKAQIVSTFNQIDYFNQVLFFKNAYDSNCTLTLILKQKEKVKFSNGIMHFTASAFPLTFMGENFEEDENTKIVTTKASFDASGPTSRYILTSSSATIVLDSKNFGKITWVVPSYIFEEWKDVIKR